MSDDKDNDKMPAIEQPSADTHGTSEIEEPQGTPQTGENGQDPVEMVPMERYKNAQALMTKATMEAADLRREVASLRAQVESFSRYTAQPQQMENRGSEFQELEKLKDEYPDFAGPLVGAFEKQQRVIQELQRSNEANEQANDAARRVSFNFEVSRVHPDFDQIAACTIIQVN